MVISPETSPCEFARWRAALKGMCCKRGNPCTGTTREVCSGDVTALPQRECKPGKLNLPGFSSLLQKKRPLFFLFGDNNRLYLIGSCAARVAGLFKDDNPPRGHVNGDYVPTVLTRNAYIR